MYDSVRSLAVVPRPSLDSNQSIRMQGAREENESQEYERLTNAADGHGMCTYTLPARPLCVRGAYCLTRIQGSPKPIGYPLRRP